MYVNEDFMMNMKLIEHIEVMACMGYVGYHYEKHVNSSLSTKQNDLYYECSKPKIEILLKKYQEWGLLTSSRKTEIYWLYIRIVYSTISRIIDTSSIAEAKNTLIKIYHDNLFDRFCTDQTIEFVYSKKEYFMYRLLKNKGIISVLLLCKIISFMKTHFIYAGDIANGIVHALTTEYANTAYNLSTQTETSLNDLVAIFGKAVGRELHPAHQAAREGDIYRSMLANKKAKASLHWQPEVSLEEGLRRTVAYFASAEL